MPPKISVIVPVYQVERYIAKCAESLMRQTLAGVEYLFVDDCTRDDSIGVLKSVLEKYPRNNTRIIRKPRNEGLPQARRTGFEQATGDYVIHIDSDDWVEENMLETLYVKAMDENADFVYCDYAEEYGTSSRVIRITPRTDAIGYAKACMQAPAYGYIWNKLIKRELYRSAAVTFPTYGMHEDLVVVTQLIAKAERIAKCDGVGYHYNRENYDSLSAKYDVKAAKMNFRTILETLSTSFPAESLEPELGDYANRIRCTLAVDKKSRGRDLVTDFHPVSLPRLFCADAGWAKKILFWLYSRKIDLYPLVDLLKKQ